MFVIHIIHAIENPSLKKSGGDGSSDDIIHSETDYEVPTKPPNLEKTGSIVHSKNDPPKKKHVLMYHPWGTPSHMHQFKPLIQGLLEAGNIVTAVFVRETKITHPDYTEIIVDDG